MQRNIDEFWDYLIRRIERGKCVPFLGAGASAEVLPLAADIAEDWAERFMYPLEDKHNLAQVAQFIALQKDAMYPKEELVENFKKYSPPNFADPNQPHMALANFPFPIYVTTNYDNFMFQALLNVKKNPHLEICKWNRLLEDYRSTFQINPHYRPTSESPVVYHLHGHYEVPESLVLTEDDYLEFLANVIRDTDIIPLSIRYALATHSFLFIGYSLRDINFRVLLRTLPPGRSGRNYAILLRPYSKNPEADQGILDYLHRYYSEMNIEIYWGDAKSFMNELRRRWEMYKSS